MSDVHDEAIKRHKHYENHGRRLPDKLSRFLATWPQERKRPERVRDEHAACLARRALMGRFL